MAKVNVRIKQNPQIKQRILASGKVSLYLEYYLGRTQEPKLDENNTPILYPKGHKMAGKPMYHIKHERKKEELKLYLIERPRTAEEREQNRQVLQLAEKIRQEREQELLNDMMGYRIDSHKNDNLITFFESYINDYNKKDIRNIKLAINRFKSFIREEKPNFVVKKSPTEIEQIDREWADKHKNVNGKHDINPNEYYRFYIRPNQLTEELINRFVDYLQTNSKGEGAHTAYARFKKVIRSAVDSGIIKKNPCTKAICESDDVLTKDVLSQKEIVTLMGAHYEGENPEIRKAFIFSLFTGVRFCDVKELRYSNVDYANSRILFEQAKTAGHSKASLVCMPLRADLLELIGKPDESDKEGLIFQLPSHTMCLKALRHWTARAGIEKHITWHCARHSFATNILSNGANIKVTANLLGHSGLKYVDKYVRAIDIEKKSAVDSLPDIII